MTKPMKISLTLLLLFLSYPLLAQKKESPCPKMDRYMKLADSLVLKKKYTDALLNLNSAQVAARDCDKENKASGKEEQVRGRILELFVKIEKLKKEADEAAREAEKQTKKANKSAKEAQIATNIATALYWASESDKIVPSQGMRLLEAAERLTKDEKALNFIEGQTKKIFSGSISHLFQEKKRYENYVSSSADGTWLITGSASGEYLVWDTRSGRVPDFLKDQKDIEYADFSADGTWLYTRSASGESLVWDTRSGRVHDFLKDQKDIEDASFSADGKLLVTASDKKVITWDIDSGKPLQTLYINTKPTQIQLIQNRYLYVVAGKAVIKTDILEQPGNLFSYGDKETLDYTYEEIKEWMEVFGDEYLGPLDEQTIEKYNVDEIVKKATVQPKK